MGLPTVSNLSSDQRPRTFASPVADRPPRVASHIVRAESVTAANCAHKDCERTDVSPLELRLMREGELIETRTYQFCPDHRRQLLGLKESRTLPPAEWFAPGYMPDIRS